MSTTTKRFIPLAFILALCGARAFAADAAETHEGRPEVVGSAISPRVIISKGKEPGVSVCKGDMATTLGDMSGMTVKVTGKLRKESEKRKAKCLDVTAVTVTRMMGGAEPIPGVLSESEGKLTFKAEGGRTYRVAKVPERLKSFVNKPVVVELDPKPTPAAAPDATYDVLSWAATPEAAPKAK